MGEFSGALLGAMGMFGAFLMIFVPAIVISGISEHLERKKEKERQKRIARRIRERNARMRRGE